ncbi:MAG: hypothetical protein JRJ86_08035 [Deltaproteobacteria bacterium]|nr:hypothetical protein [Deltaproteobacteria bacterium]HDZ24781.1 hypothetical protein [Desulfobacteraceae bacterium]
MLESTAAGLGLNKQQMNYNNTVNDQARVVEQNAKAREQRPVEDAGDSSKPKAWTQDKTTTETIIDDENVIVFTRYDSDGREINRVPPGYAPLDERV